MNDFVQNIFKNKVADETKLISFGFQFENQVYRYVQPLENCNFKCEVIIAKDKTQVLVIDCDFNEPYTLYLNPKAQGEFVGNIRAQVEEILTNIVQSCFIPCVFQSRQASQIIDYIQDTYQDELEFLWKKSPESAIVRRKDNQKWYIAFMAVDQRKLGLMDHKRIEIIDLRVTSNEIEEMTDYKHYFPGYHMNKKHWITIILDNGLSTEEIIHRIDESYKLAQKK